MPIVKKVLASVSTAVGNQFNITVPQGKQITISTISIAMDGDPTPDDSPGGFVDIAAFDASLTGLPPEANPYDQSGACTIVPYAPIYNGDAKYLTLGLTFREGDIIAIYMDTLGAQITITFFGAIEDIGDTVKVALPVQSASPVI